MQPGSSPTTLGDPRSPGIVFVHGTRMAGAYWHAQCAALSDSYHVVAPDLPGHGAQRAVRFSHVGALETIRASIGTCAGGTAVVVGHSLGGYLAIDLAARSPELVRALVLTGCSAVTRGPGTWPYRAIVKILPFVSDDRLTRLNDRLLRRLYPPEFVEPQIAAGYGFAAIAPAWRSVLGRNHALSLREYAGPVLLVNGKRDIPFRSNERYFLRSCVQGRLRIIAGAGHLCNLDRPTEFTNELRAFVSSLPPTR